VAESEIIAPIHYLQPAPAMIAGVIFFRKPDTNCDNVIMKKIWNPGKKSEKRLDNIISGYYITYIS